LFIYFLDSAGHTIIPDKDIKVIANFSDGSKDIICITAYQTPIDANKKCYFGTSVVNYCNNCTIEPGPYFVSYTYELGTC
jgi:hypothetical protein